MRYIWKTFLLLMLGFQMNVFADEVKFNNLTGSLMIRSSYFFNSQKSEPLEATFYLLDKNFAEILKSEKFEPVDDDGNLLTDDDSFLEAFGNSLHLENEDSGVISILLDDTISAHKIAAIKTNSKGIGKSKTIRAGNYFLFGWKQTNDEVLVWHIPIWIGLGNRTIELDQYNAIAPDEIKRM